MEGFLYPLPKGDVLLHTYHIDHLGSLESTHKSYKHILVVVDAFTKFVWLYPTKSTTAKDGLEKLKNQKKIFDNPSCTTSDRGTAFTAGKFQNYCEEECIEQHKIITGLLSANGQVERVNFIIIPILSTLSIEKPSKWNKHVKQLQQTINFIYQRSIDTTPFELKTGVKMKKKVLRTKELMKTELRDKIQNEFKKGLEELRKSGKVQIQRIQEENRHAYNLKRRLPKVYELNSLVAIKPVPTKFGTGLKLRKKYLGPYVVTKKKSNATYDVVREDNDGGPYKTTTCAESMKP